MLEDVKQFEKTYRPNIYALKGNTTYINMDPVVTDYIKVPREVIKANKNITIIHQCRRIICKKYTLLHYHDLKHEFTTTKCISNSTMKNIVSSMETVK